MAWVRILAIFCAVAVILCWQGTREVRAQPEAAPAAAPTAPTEPTEEQTQKTLQTPTEPSEPARATPGQVERGGLLVGKRKRDFEYRLSWAHFSRNVIFIDGVAILPVLVVGEVAVEHIRRDVLIASVAGRWGLTDKLQVELKIPYRYQNDRNSIPDANPPQEASLSDRGIGDIEAGAFYELPTSAAKQTKLVAGLRIKTRTGRDVFEINPATEQAMGTGFYSARTSLTAIQVSDPAAIFGTLGWSYNFPRRNLLVTYTDSETGQPVQTTASFYPGSSLEFGVGLAYALNPKLSINSQFSASFTRGTKVQTGGVRVPVAGSSLTVGSFRIGAVWVNSPRCTTEFSVDNGLTTDAADMVVELRRSYRY